MLGTLFSIRATQITVIRKGILGNVRQRTTRGRTLAIKFLTWKSGTPMACSAALHTAAPVPGHSSRGFQSPHPCCYFWR